MFFFKRNSEDVKKLRSIINDQSKDIEFLENEVESLKLHLLERINQNSSTISEIDDDLSENKQIEKQSYGSVISQMDDMKQDHIVSNFETNLRIDSLEKMQRAIATWIVVLCATSLFSFLLYFKII
jgi:hypothetical protein